MRDGLWSLFSKELLSSLAGRGGGGAGLLAREVEAGDRSYTYQVYVPAETASVGPPLIVFLHGINSRGEGGYLPSSGPKGALVRGALGRVPAVVLFPHCRQGSYWSDTVMDEMVLGALGHAIEEFGVDAARVYLAGVSMGGYGVWSLASRHAGKFAALVSLCGGSPLREGDRFAPIAREVGPVPAWLFHGAEDRVVPVTESRRMVEALKLHGGEVRYTEYPGVGHDVWTKVLTEKELLPWLFSKRL